MPQKRQLAAIMFTDIEGYTNLMQQDESIAIELRNTHRTIFEGATNKFNGEIIQYFGDGQGLGLEAREGERQVAGQPDGR